MRRIIDEESAVPYTPRFHFDVDQPELVYLREPRQALFVAVTSDGEIIGTGGIRTGGPTAPPFPYELASRYSWESTAQLCRIYVDKTQRRRGVASTLVEAARRFVVAAGGYDDIYLHTDASVEGAEPFWRSVARLTYDGRLDGGPSSAVHFELPINRPLSAFRSVHEMDAIDWQDWYWRWEHQQSSYIEGREQRFEAMLDVLARTMPEEFTLIDLMCGPGAIARRVIQRFPQARVIAIDLDPVLMALGKNSISDPEGRTRWLEADFNDQSWPEQLGIAHVDAVLSTTAIHWLRAGGIVDLYRTLARVVRLGGVVLNGDQMDFVEALPAARRLGQEVRESHRMRARALGAESWEDWWHSLRQEPALASLLEERDRRFSWRPAASEKGIGSTHEHGSPIPQRHTHFDVHLAGLLDAGFREVDVVWQHFANRVLMAVR